MVCKESIGTAHGVFHARSKGKTVVVVDPNRIQNRMLTFYADAVATTLHEGMRTLRQLLRVKRALFEVVKSDGTRKPFDMAKLIDSVRKACVAAGKSDILVPVVVVPMSLTRISDYAARASGTVKTSVIRDSIWEVLAECEPDPLLVQEYAGIRQAWEQYDLGPKTKKRERSIDSGEAIVHERPLAVQITSAQHSTIWGPRIRVLRDLPNAPRQVFETLLRVEGISNIKFG